MGTLRTKSACRMTEVREGLMQVWKWMYSRERALALTYGVSFAAAVALFGTVLAFGGRTLTIAFMGAIIVNVFCAAYACDCVRRRG